MRERRREGEARDRGTGTGEVAGRNRQIQSEWEGTVRCQNLVSRISMMMALLDRKKRTFITELGESLHGGKVVPGVRV